MSCSPANSCIYLELCELAAGHACSAIMNGGAEPCCIRPDLPVTRADEHLSAVNPINALKAADRLPLEPASHPDIVLP